MDWWKWYKGNVNKCFGVLSCFYKEYGVVLNNGIYCDDVEDFDIKDFNNGVLWIESCWWFDIV